MRAKLNLALSIGLLAFVSLQSTYAADRSVFDTTVFAGYRYGGEFDDTSASVGKHKLESSTSYGITLNLEQQPGAYYELTYSKQDATVKDAGAYDLAIEYLHIGGHVEFRDPEDKVIPYFVLTVGATRLTPKNGALENSTEPSVGIGAGVKFPFTKNIGLRTEIRGYATFVDSESNLFCVTDTTGTTCNASIRGQTLMQAQGLIGLTIGF